MTRSTAGRILAVAVLTILSTVAACTTDPDPSAGGDAPDNGDPVADETDTPEWLFAVQSEGVSTYDRSTSTLSIPTRTVEAFTDRPHRDSRITTPQSFVALWSSLDPDSFAADPPNAVLTYWEDEAGRVAPRTAACEVTGAVTYSGDGNLSMAVRLLDPGVRLPARLYRASLFVDDVSAPCVTSAQDELNIEYFNEISFDDGFEVSVTVPTPGADPRISLSCPPRPSPTLPGPDFDVTLSAADGSQSTSCDGGGSLTVGGSDPWCHDSTCEVMIAAVDTSTSTRYSSTLVEVDVAGVTPATPRSSVPQLEPATAPICAATLTSTPSRTPTGDIELCEDPRACSQSDGTGSTKLTIPPITVGTQP